MAGISSKALAFGSPQNKYKFNDGNELQSNEFSDGSGLEMFDAVNRMYDPQIGRFWQIDELAEANWEWTPYNFAINNPISFNDPLGLKEGDPNDPKVLPEVVIISIPKGHWAKQRLYYDIMDQLNRRGATIDQIVQPGLREMMYRYDGITKHRERVAEMTRASDKAFLEFASWFAPTGWITKVKYVKYAAKLFQWKRGKAAVKATEEVTEQVLKHGDEAAKGGENVVYHSVEDGVTQYVGITNNLARRQAEHLTTKGIKIEPLMQGLSRTDARAVEQALIEIHGLGKNGGTLINKINSIATSNPTYSAQLERGYELLKSIGYK
jgi:RHS repeat-associated protein